MPAPANLKTRPSGLDLLDQAHVTPEKRSTLWFIFGPRKVGKSTTAMTSSRMYADHVGIPSCDRIVAVRKGDFKRVDLEDMVWLQVDQGASESSLDLGCRIPYVYSVLSATAKGYEATDAAVALIEAAGERHTDRKTLVIDTISVLDSLTFVNSIELGGADPRSKYDIQLQKHRRIYAAVNKWDGDVIVCSHPRALSDAGEDKKGNIRKARKAAYQKEPEIVPAITGKGAGVWLDNASLIGAMLQRPVPNGKNQWRKRLFTGNTTGYEGGSRFESLLLTLAEQEGADLLKDGIDPTMYRIVDVYNERLA